LGWEDADGNPLPVFMTRFANTGIFTWEGTLFRGGFKISADSNPRWEGRWFLPTGIDNIPLTHGSEFPVRYSTTGDGGESGAQFTITEDAKYRITLNTETRIIQCEKIGDAEGSGTDVVFNVMWFIRCDPEAPVPFPMTQDGENWVITRTLNRGDFVKFNGDDDPPTVWGT
jgi:hypothetical protein